MLRPFARGFTLLTPELMGKNVIWPSLIPLFGSVEKERLLLSNSLAGIASQRIFYKIAGGWSSDVGWLVNWLVAGQQFPK